MVPTLKIVRMIYPIESAANWNKSCELLTSSRACDYLKNILSGKVSRRAKGTRRFFGEAYVATQISHGEGYYGSFQWLTNPTFLGDRTFPEGPTQEFQQQYRHALHLHFQGQLERLQENARALEQGIGIRPAAPDLWLIDLSGNHRFIEVKLPHDEVSDNQLAGLVVIAASLRGKSNVSVEVIELYPDNERRLGLGSRSVQRVSTQQRYST
jgi:hypothetical protein